MGDAALRITGGPNGCSQALVFEEAPGVTYVDSGEHLCIFIGAFEEVFQRCLRADVIFSNPRFQHLDDVRTLDEAREAQTFRMKEFSADGHVVFSLEHEVRSLRFPRPGLSEAEGA